MHKRVLAVSLLLVVAGFAGCKRPGKAGVWQPREKVQPTEAMGAEPSVATRLGVKFGEEVLLVGYNLAPETITKGRPATLEIIWKCLSKPSRDWRVFTHFDYRGPQPGKLRRLNRSYSPALALSKWQPGKYYRDKLTFIMPNDFPGGIYSLSIGLYLRSTTGASGAPQFTNPPETVQVGGERFGYLAVAPSRGEKALTAEGESEQPPVSEKLGVTFGLGKELLLVGYNVRPSPVQKGKKAEIEIVWQCLKKPSRNWDVGTYVDRPGDPSARQNLSHSPQVPMTLWKPEKYYRDKVEFTPPDSLKPGRYTVSIGVYKRESDASYADLPAKAVEGGKLRGTLEIGYSSGG